MELINSFRPLTGFHRFSSKSENRMKKYFENCFRPLTGFHRFSYTMTKMLTRHTERFRPLTGFHRFSLEEILADDDLGLFDEFPSPYGVS